ncbi:MAG: ATP-binding cassette domain-containing protein [Bacteroidia bacterium]
MINDSQLETPFASGTAKADNRKVIEIKSLQKSFGKQTVLSDVSLELFKEENLVVLGKSGSGKSVLIKCIVGLLFPDTGEINVLGKSVLSLNPNELNELRKKIGFLFQGSALYDSMTVKQNLEFPLKRIFKKLSQQETDDKVNEALENVGLIEALHKMPSQLSGGMRKRIGLARTIIVDPQIMLYDEPTTGLDPITSNEISQLINDVQKKYHTSSIIITHDLPCARITANRVLMLKDGEVYANGTLKELENSSDEWIKSFFK